MPRSAVLASRDSLKRDGDDGAFRFNFATPQPILTEMVKRVAAALTAG